MFKIWRPWTKLAYCMVSKSESVCSPEGGGLLTQIGGGGGGGLGESTCRRNVLLGITWQILIMDNNLL